MCTYEVWCVLIFDEHPSLLYPRCKLSLPLLCKPRCGGCGTLQKRQKRGSNPARQTRDRNATETPRDRKATEPHGYSLTRAHGMSPPTQVSARQKRRATIARNNTDIVNVVTHPSPLLGIYALHGRREKGPSLARNLGRFTWRTTLSWFLSTECRGRGCFTALPLPPSPI